MNAYAHLNDTDLAEKLCCSDSRSAAVAEFYDRYFKPLYKKAHSLTRDEEQAKDLVHDVFASLLTTDINFDPSKSVSSYLFTSLKNLVIDLVRRDKLKVKHRVHLIHLLDGNYDATDARVIRNERTQAIEREIKNLPPKMRAVFEMSREEYLTRKQMAERANISEETVKTQLSNAIKTLRNKLRKDYLFELMLLILFINRL